MKHELEVIVGKDVLLDGNAFYDCLLQRCTIIFSGLEPVDMEACVLEECHFLFIGPAERTMRFLRNYNKAAGPDACEFLIQELMSKEWKP